jgi:HJR/Mrr/RecB family endonuclease
MSPAAFEEFVASLWANRGWETTVVGGTADRGVDVKATKRDSFEERQHLIQVKRHGQDSKVGSEKMQSYVGLYNRYDADRVFVVTSNRFTSEAEAVAVEGDVKTIDSDELYEMFVDE